MTVYGYARVSRQGSVSSVTGRRAASGWLRPDIRREGLRRIEVVERHGAPLKIEGQQPVVGDPLSAPNQMLTGQLMFGSAQRQADLQQRGRVSFLRLSLYSSEKPCILVTPSSTF